MVKCHTCGGSGKIPDWMKSQCKKCNGTGRIGGGLFSKSHSCSACDGTGVKSPDIGATVLDLIFGNDPCPTCKGKGYI